MALNYELTIVTLIYQKRLQHAGKLDAVQRKVTFQAGLALPKSLKIANNRLAQNPITRVGRISSNTALNHSLV